MAQQFQRRTFFRNRPIRNKNCMWWPCLLTDRAIFIEDISKMLPTKFRWQPCLQTDWDEMSNFHREHSIDASYQASVVAMFVNRSGRNEQSSQRTFHRFFLPSFGSFGQAVSEEKISKNLPIRNKNCLWRPCLVMDHNKMCTLQRGPFIHASYQVSVHLAEGFQRRRLKCEK